VDDIEQTIFDSDLEPISDFDDTDDESNYDEIQVNKL